MVVDPVVEAPTSSEPVTTPVAQETTVEAGLEDTLIVQELIIEMEQGENIEKPLSKLLDDSTHILDSAPRYAQAFQTSLERSLAVLAAV